MSELSYLEKLLDGVEVEWLPLAKVCRLINGRAYKQEELLSKGKYPVLRVGNFFTNQNWYYSDLELDQDKYCDNGDLLYAWSASFGPRIWHGGKSIYHYHIWKVVPDSNLICKQFLYYLLQWDTKALKDAHSTGSTMMHISKTTIEKRLVPIPCPDNPEKSLAIQSEIVRILDKFTALTAELTAELNMRKKQYNYYRDQLLRFKEGEVEWRNLGDTSLFEIANNGRKPVKASLRIAGETPYYGANNIQDYVDGYTHDGEYVLIAEDGSASLENYSIQYATGKFWANNHVHVVRGKERVHSRFLYHYLCIVNFLPFLTGGGRAKLTKGQLIEIPVPIPCPDNPEKSLAIQSEIVRILDTFTALTAELSAELNMRKKQYNYYRDQLLSFKEGEVEWKTLGEIGHFTRGKRFVKTDMLSEGYPCIHYGEMYTYYNVWTNKTKSFVSQELASKLRVSEYVDVIIVAAGETIEDIGKGTAWLGKSNVVFHDACFSYRCLLNPKYIAYFTRTKIFHDQIKKHISSGKISAINANGLSKVKIPMLSAKEQARIVEILDKFDTLTNSITEGLPREIELRQKQYEYYRDMLFSFPKPEVAEA